MKRISEFIENDFLHDFANLSEDTLEIDSLLSSSFMKRIYSELMKKNKICIVGDYDVDGFFSTIVLENYMKLLEARLRDVSIDMSSVSTYYTKREHGYEMPEDIFNALDAQNDFIIFLDTGAGNRYFNKDTNNVLIIDHHPTDNRGLDFILNPNVSGDVSTSTGRIVYEMTEQFEDKLISYFGRHKIKHHPIMDYNKILAGVTLVSDMAEMSFANKLFLKEALDTMDSFRNSISWIKSLASRNITSTDLSFNLINKINSISRMGEELKQYEDIFRVGVDIKNTRHLSSSKKINQLLDNLNTIHSQRKLLSSSLEAQNNKIIKEKNLSKNDIIAIVSANKHSGINGLLAQSILNATSKPSLVVSYDMDREKYVGSARGYGIKDAIANIVNTNELFKQNISFGGHSMACGVSCDLPLKDLEIFLDSLSKTHLQDKLNEREKFYLCDGVSEFKEAVAYYNNLSPSTNIQERYYAVIENYHSLGIVEKSNGWFTSSIRDESQYITLYFKEGDIEHISNQKPLVLEISNNVEQNYFLEHKEIGDVLIENLSEVEEKNKLSEDDHEDLSLSSLMGQ